MQILTKTGCFLIGWNFNILKECGEASFRTFKRLMSAIVIMMVIWGTIGFCFADNYIGINSTIGKIAIALIFMILVLCIERFIILTIGRLGWMGLFRTILAIVMAMLGSTVFDQIIFRNDIAVKMTDIREIKIQQAIKNRMETYDADIKHFTNLRDSLGAANIVIYEKLAKQPVIATRDVTTKDVVIGKNEDGTPQMAKTTSVTSRSVENPLSAQAKANEEQIKRYQTQLETLQTKKFNTDKEVRNEFRQKEPGFLEELTALWALLKADNIALIFYIILFVFLMSLELLVVTSRGGDTKCDYELIVEHQLNIKKEMLSKSEEKLLNKN